MKKLLLLLFLFPILISNKPIDEKEISHDFFGVWQSIDNEFVQITRNSDFEVSFMRVTGTKKLQSKGLILDSSEGKLQVQRQFPQNEMYISDYTFSPSGKTLVIMKPNSNQAWVFHKVQ